MAWGGGRESDGGLSGRADCRSLFGMRGPLCGCDALTTRGRSDIGAFGICLFAVCHTRFQREMRNYYNDHVQVEQIS